MNIKELFKWIVFYVSVPKCVSCRKILSAPGSPFCEDCLKLYAVNKDKQCSVCFKKLSECSCVNSVLKSARVKKHIKLYRYVNLGENPSSRIIFSLKEDNRRDVADFLANELYKSVLHVFSETSEFVFTHVPRRKAATKKFGYDHAAMLSKALAKKCGADFCSPLRSVAKKAQKEVSGIQRKKNAKFVIKRRAKRLDGKNVVIVDDVVTTGSSVSGCAALLYSLGAKTVVCVSVSVAYRDEYTPFVKTDRFNPNLRSQY